jgi:hypothetical protein
MIRFDRVGCCARFVPVRCGISLVAGLAVVAAAVGCSGSDGLNRKAITGKVTVDGAPIPNGAIGFEPIGGSGIGSGAPIVKGEYRIETKDGLPPGKYRVTLQGDDGTKFGVSEGKMPGDEEMPAIKQLVPPDWNKGGEHNIEVKDSGPYEFNFDVKSK